MIAHKPECPKNFAGRPYQLIKPNLSHGQGEQVLDDVGLLQTLGQLAANVLFAPSPILKALLKQFVDQGTDQHRP
jgi:hypothetical protein